MKIHNNIAIILSAIFCTCFISCSNEENYFTDEPTEQSQVIYSDIVFDAENGNKENSITRGLDSEGFTNEYPYEYIYVHSTTDNSKTLEVPLKEVEYCDGCKGIHLEMEITDNGTGYTLRTETGDEIVLDENEEVYFSSYGSNIWEATPLEGVSTPVSHNDVFIKDDNVNKELLRSETTYDKEALITLLQTPTPKITLKRHCTGFSVVFMFTNVDESESLGYHDYSVTPVTWRNYLPGTTPDDFYIKLYIGPNFCHTYDIFNNSVPEDDKGGYYVIQNNKYIPLTSVDFGNSGLGGTEGVSYVGLGYATSLEDILLAPLNSSMDLTNFAIYAFVKYMPNGGDVDSDAGSVWLKIPIEDISFTFNRVHNFIIALDINELKDVMDLTGAKTLTRGYWNEPTQIELKHHAIVKHFEN